MKQNQSEIDDIFSSKMVTSNVIEWTENDVIQWLRQNGEIASVTFIRAERLDGKSLLALTEDDIRDLRLKYHSLRLGDWKHFWIAVRGLQKENHFNLVQLGLIESIPTPTASTSTNAPLSHHQSPHHHHHHHHMLHHCSCCSDISSHDMDRISPPLSIDGRATSIQPEVFKAMISLGEYNKLFVVSFISNECLVNVDASF